MKAMISQPMAGKTDNEITETRDRACAKLRECRIEHDIAVAYGLEVLYEA